MGESKLWGRTISHCITHLSPSRERLAFLVRLFQTQLEDASWLKSPFALVSRSRPDSGRWDALTSDPKGTALIGPSANYTVNVRGGIMYLLCSDLSEAGT